MPKEQKNVISISKTLLNISVQEQQKKLWFLYAEKLELF